jgi:hypothetical protein
MTASRRDRMRPFELIGIAVIVGVFTGIVVLMSTRDVTLSAIWLGVAFIAMLVISATVILMIRPRKDELADIEELAAAAPARTSATTTSTKKPTTAASRSAETAKPAKKK